MPKQKRKKKRMHAKKIMTNKVLGKALGKSRRRTGNSILCVTKGRTFANELRNVSKGTSGETNRERKTHVHKTRTTTTATTTVDGQSHPSTSLVLSNSSFEVKPSFEKLSAKWEAEARSNIDLEKEMLNTGDQEVKEFEKMFGPRNETDATNTDRENSKTGSSLATTENPFSALAEDDDEEDAFVLAPATLQAVEEEGKPLNFELAKPSFGL